MEIGVLKKSKIPLLIICAGLLCVSLNAQGIWSLQACIDTAFNRNISLHQEQLNSRINKVKLVQSKTGFLPNLNINDAHTLNYGTVYEPSVNQYFNSSISVNDISISSSVTLFNGFLLLNTVRQNKLIYEAGMLDVEQLKIDIMLDVLAGYMQVLMDYEAIDVAQAQMEETDIQVKQTQKFVDFGKLAELSLLQIKSQYAAEKLIKVVAENQLQLDKLTLLQLMDVPVRRDFDIARQELKDLFPEIPMSPGEIDKISEGFLPEIKSASLKTNASVFSLKMNQSGWFPKLMLNGSLTSFLSNLDHDPVPYQFANNFGQTVGLTLSVPIFNNLQVRSSVAISKINLSGAQLNEQQTKNDLRKTIETAYTNMVSAGKNLTVTEEQMELEKRTYSEMATKYSVGAVDATDFLVEKNNYDKVSMTLIQTKYNYVLTAKIVDFYLGKPITNN
jgi:outer membrane protein